MNLLTSTHTRIHRAFSRSLLLIRQNRTPFLILQLSHWSLTLLGVILAIRNPSIQSAAIKRANSELDSYSLGKLVVHAYDSGDIPLASVLTLGINLFVGALGTVSLPSALVPFSGLLMQGYRAFIWGKLFAPVKGGKKMGWHWVTVVMEGQGYILACLGVWIQGIRVLKRLLRREKGVRALDGGDEGLMRGYFGTREEWRDTLALYVPITAVLAVSAVWEAYEVIYLTNKTVKA